MVKQRRRFAMVTGLACILGTLALSSCKSKQGDDGADGADARGPNGGSSAAEKTYVLAKPGHIFPTGTKVNLSLVMQVTEIPMKVTAGDQEMTGILSSKSEEDILAEILSAGEATFDVKKSREENNVVMNGNPVPEPPDVSPLEGKKLTFTLQDGSWTGTFSGGEAFSPGEKDDADTLLKTLLTREDDLDTYGTEPRKVGDEWECDPASMSAFSNDDAKPSGTIKMKLLSTEKHAGFDCAVLEAKFDVEMEASEGAGTSFTMKGDMKVYRSLEHLADLAVDLDGTIEVKGSPQPGVMFSANGPFVMQQRLSLDLP